MTFIKPVIATWPSDIWDFVLRVINLSILCLWVINTKVLLIQDYLLKIMFIYGAQTYNRCFTYHCAYHMIASKLQISNKFAIYIQHNLSTNKQWNTIIKLKLVLFEFPGCWWRHVMGASTAAACARVHCSLVRPWRILRSTLQVNHVSCFDSVF